MHVFLAPRVSLPLLALMVVGCGFLERPLERGAALVYRALVAWATRGALWTEARVARNRLISLAAERARRRPPLVVVQGRPYRIVNPWIARVLLWTQRQD